MESQVDLTNGKQEDKDKQGEESPGLTTTITSVTGVKTEKSEPKQQPHSTSTESFVELQRPQKVSGISTHSQLFLLTSFQPLTTCMTDSSSLHHPSLHSINNSNLTFASPSTQPPGPTRMGGNHIIQYGTDGHPYFLQSPQPPAGHLHGGNPHTASVPLLHAAGIGVASHNSEREVNLHLNAHHNNQNIPNNESNEIISEGGNKKREMRLMKNREAARECRRKKKEYIKCLENRVAVLENQNKALIEELKSLKELYTGKQMVRKGDKDY